MDKNDNYFPQTDREKVIVYQLLSELSDLMYKDEPGFFASLLRDPTTVPKQRIRDWMEEQRKLLAED